MTNLGDFRPKTLDDFVGFDVQKQNLRDNIAVLNHDIKVAQDAERIGDGVQNSQYFISAPHILLVGLPGFGKTTLGELYATEMVHTAKTNDWPIWSDECPMDRWAGGGVPETYKDRFRFVRLDATKVESFEQLDHYIYWLEAYGVILIDEIHALKPSIQEHLLELMHDGKYQSPLARERLDTNRLQRMGWTLVGTTTDESKLGDAFLSRFDTTVQLRKYRDEDLGAIVEYAAEIAGVSLTDDAVDVVVNRGRKTPRDIVKLVRKIRDLSVLNKTQSRPQGTDEAIIAAERIGIGSFGLTPRDQEVISYLDEHGKAGARTLTKACGYGSIDNYDTAEAYLIAEGFVVPGAGGRRLSDYGARVAKQINT